VNLLWYSLLSAVNGLLACQHFAVGQIKVVETRLWNVISETCKMDFRKI